MDVQEILSFADIDAEEVEWLWYPYVPYGKVTILQGDPGTGKTMFMLALVARLTNGAGPPFSEEPAEPITVIYQTAEDGLADTIKPRLERAGADCSRVKLILEKQHYLTFGDPRLEEAVLQENARLLILDPLSAYAGAEVNMNQSNEVRRAIRPLYDMAQRTGCAVVLVTHMNKAEGVSPLYRTSGSIDVAGSVRSILTVLKYERSRTRRIVVPVKSNLAPIGDGILFDLSDRVEWVGQMEADADSLLNGCSDKPTAVSKQSQAAEELPLLLQNGPLPQKEIVSYFEQQGISKRTAELAKNALCIKSIRVQDGWCWALPEHPNA